MAMPPTQYWKFTGAITLQTPGEFLHGPPYIPIHGLNTCSRMGGGEMIDTAVGAGNEHCGLGCSWWEPMQAQGAQRHFQECEFVIDLERLSLAVLKSPSCLKNWYWYDNACLCCCFDLRRTFIQCRKSSKLTRLCRVNSTPCSTYSRGVATDVNTSDGLLMWLSQ